MKTPVVMIIFNRPDTTRQVFSRIRDVQPQQLFIVADGPRPDREGEKEKVNATRKIVSEVDWPCNVTKIFSSANLGCKQRVYSGLNEVFEHVDKAIVLEDDCLPDLTFFNYCETLLERYENDNRIMHITGNNFQYYKRRSRYSYFFSKYNHIWGWATWKRAWTKMDIDLKSFDDPKVHQKLLDSFDSPEEKKFWLELFSQIHAGTHNTSSWAYPWTYSCWVEGGLTCYPSKNLVENIGFGEEATHTFTGAEQLQVKAKALHKITHPTKIVRNQEADRFTLKRVFFFQEVRYLKRLYNTIKIQGGRIKRMLLFKQ